MSNSRKVRIKRGPPPAKRIKRHRYRDALPELLRDFERRCAYSMQHESRAGMMEVDHFDPRKKKDILQDYDNLFPASRHCNCKKSNHWPTKSEAAVGCRFLNPCEELDYGEQIFEDPASYKLVGATPAARWHIRICGLNADHLVKERTRRAEHLDLLKRKSIRLKHGFNDVLELVRHFRSEVELMIPEIAPLTIQEPS
jgi:hypothetical protein